MICAFTVGLLTPTFLIPEIRFLRVQCIELQYEDGTSHSCHDCLQIQFGVEKEAKAEVNFTREEVIYVVCIGHNPHAL